MTVDELIVLIADFLRPLMPAATKIARGQSNDVPPNLPPSIVLTPILTDQYTTTRSVLDRDAQREEFLQPKALHVQMDFYGLQSSTMCNTAVTMLQSAAISFFPADARPHYCTSPRQIPLMTGEKQYEERWTSTLAIQYNESITIDQESFINLGSVVADPCDQTIPAE